MDYIDYINRLNSFPNIQAAYITPARWLEMPANTEVSSCLRKCSSKLSFRFSLADQATLIEKICIIFVRIYFTFMVNYHNFRDLLDLIFLCDRTSARHFISLIALPILSMAMPFGYLPKVDECYAIPSNPLLYARADLQFHQTLRLFHGKEPSSGDLNAHPVEPERMQHYLHTTFGDNINVPDQLGITLLAYAASQHLSNGVSTLLQMGATPTAESRCDPLACVIFGIQIEYAPFNRPLTFKTEEYNRSVSEQLGNLLTQLKAADPTFDVNKVVEAREILSTSMDHRSLHEFRRKLVSNRYTRSCLYPLELLNALLGREDEILTRSIWKTECKKMVANLDFVDSLQNI